ncbi:MAG TPA: OmpA family protein, partial [Candidatus Eisenbacteria bacterium]|nr:OmpA family protein [Candidatus Eisenbacteria bacterium]
ATGRDRQRPQDRQQPALRRRISGTKAQRAPAPRADAALLTPQGVIHLQRAAGNQAVEVMLRRDRHLASPGLAGLPARGIAVQRDINGSFPTALGGWEVDLQTKTGALTGAGASGMDVKLKFTPDKKSPYTTKLGIIQIIKVTDAGGANVDIASLPATTGPQVRTKEDKAAGVEGGFYTDVLHQNFGPAGPVGPPHQAGDQLLPYYQGGVPIFGFRRSEDAADIKSAQITDSPGTTSAAVDLDFSFEDVAKGDDNQVEYGALTWGFKLRKGAVKDERLDVADTGSATFDAALEKHRAFYTHEPVTIYFDFAKDKPSAGEDAKIATFLPYLRRFPDVRLAVTGFADRRGAVKFNLDLATRRSESVVAALVAKGVPADSIDLQPPGGATEAFSSDATTSQDREANRRANRRVTIVFNRTASTPTGP